MKQGSGRNVTEIKREPNVSVINVKAVSQIGSAMGNHVTGKSKSLDGNVISETLYAGRGFENPRDRSVEVFNGGSQGKR
jgi:hypothetical protein